MADQKNTTPKNEPPSSSPRNRAVHPTNQMTGKNPRKIANRPAKKKKVPAKTATRNDFTKMTTISGGVGGVDTSKA
jgi:hypothetical protein